MTHAKSLRVIGQSLEAARVAVFELENDGDGYIVRSDSLTDLNKSDSFEPGGRCAAIRSLRFNPSYISRLDAQGHKQRRNYSLARLQTPCNLSRLLRTLGDLLDRNGVSAFHISWMSDSVSVDCRGFDGQSDCMIFSSEKLRQLGLYTRIRRSSHRA